MNTARKALGRIPAGGWFILAFLLFCSLYEYGRILNLRPLPHHLMRQTDCLGQVWNYAFVDANLFHPRTMNLHADDDTDGESAGEFPLLYWIVGMLWRAFGQSEFIYRLIGVLLHVAGSYALFRTASRLLRSEFWGAWMALLFFTSPATVYFAISFLPDVPAFDMALIGAWWMVKYGESRRRSHLVVALLFMALGALLKVTAGMLLLALLGVLFLETVMRQRIKGPWRLFPDRGTAWIAFIVAIVIIISWYAYAAWYNDLHGFAFTPNGFWPIWRTTSEEMAIMLRFAREILVFEIFTVPAWLIYGAAAGAVLWNIRRLPWQVVVVNSALLIGLALYVPAWFRALDNHDYYFINPQIVPMVLLMTALWWVGKSRPVVLRSAWTKAAGGTVLACSFACAATDLQLRTWAEDPIKEDRLLPLYTEAQLAHWNRSNYWDNFGLVDLEPISRSLGITRDDRVLFATDRTWQTSLYLMGQRGWNDFTVELEDSAKVDHYMRSHGASFLILNSREWLRRPYMRPFLKHPMARNHEVRIFDLRPLR